MKEKDLKKLRRSDLLEILLEQSEKIDILERQLEQARLELKDRTIAITSAGSIAEAALYLNNIFQAAQDAASQYLENIERLSGAQEEICARREAESQKMASAVIADAKRKSEAMITDARKKAQAYWDEVNKRTNSLLTARKELELLINNTVTWDKTEHT